jgi:hypothetical protein
VTQLHAQDISWQYRVPRLCSNQSPADASTRILDGGKDKLQQWAAAENMISDEFCRPFYLIIRAAQHTCPSINQHPSLRRWRLFRRRHLHTMRHHPKFYSVVLPSETRETEKHADCESKRAFLFASLLEYLPCSFEIVSAAGRRRIRICVSPGQCRSSRSAYTLKIQFNTSSNGGQNCSASRGKASSTSSKFLQ